MLKPKIMNPENRKGFYKVYFGQKSKRISPVDEILF
jgi:hypothetical protein